MGLAIVGIIAIFIIPSLISTINLENKNQEDKELLDYSKSIVESIKADIYNDKEINITNNIKEEFDYYYEIDKLEDLRKLSIVVWRVGNEEKTNRFEIILPPEI